ncbi:hypothetical protein Tco_1102974 [Tanacetum coccineum]
MFQPSSVSKGDTLLMLLEQQENTHLVQVVATRENHGLLYVTIAKGRVILQSSALSLSGKGDEKMSTTHNAAYQAMIWIEYDSDCDEITSAKICLMANSQGMDQNALMRSNEKFAEIANLAKSFRTRAKKKDSFNGKQLSEKSRSKMLLKEQDPLIVKNKINTRPINYDILNNDYYKRFVRQTDLYSEHAYWKETSVPPLDPSHSSTTVIVEVPKELPTVSMVNTSLKELKRYLTGFDRCSKKETTGH